MNPTITGVITSVAVVLAIASAFYLMRLGNSLAALLRKIGPYAAMLFATISFFLGMMDDMEEYIGLKYFFVIAAVTVVASVLIDRAFSISRRFLMRPEEEKVQKRRRVRIKLPTQATLCVLDSISLAAAGFSLGANFSMNVGTGFFVAIALFFFIYIQRLASIDRIEKRISVKAGKINFYISLGAFLVASILTVLLIGQNTVASCVCISISAGYLLYLLLWHFYNLVRTIKK